MFFYLFVTTDWMLTSAYYYRFSLLSMDSRTRLVRPNSQELTTSKNGNLTRLIHTLAICVTIGCDPGRVVVVSHIQRIGCQPEKTTLHGGQSRSWSAEQGKKKKKEKVWERPPPPPPRALLVRRKKKKKKITRRIHISRRYASRRYAGGLGPSRIRTRIPTTHQLGQWVSLRETLRFRVRLQLSQSRCLSLLLAMSGCVFLFLPPRGHEPPPTLRDRLNPTLSLYRHRFPNPRYVKRPDEGIGWLTVGTIPNSLYRGPFFYLSSYRFVSFLFCFNALVGAL